MDNKSINKTKTAEFEKPRKNAENLNKNFHSIEKKSLNVKEIGEKNENYANHLWNYKKSIKNIKTFECIWRTGNEIQNSAKRVSIGLKEKVGKSWSCIQDTCWKQEERRQERQTVRQIKNGENMKKWFKKLSKHMKWKTFTKISEITKMQKNSFSLQNAGWLTLDTHRRKLLLEKNVLFLSNKWFCANST